MNLHSLPSFSNGCILDISLQMDGGPIGTWVLDNYWYVHYDVMHSRNFVDPGTGAHTNTIDDTWTHAKRAAGLRSCRGGLRTTESLEMDLTFYMCGCFGFRAHAAQVLGWPRGVTVAYKTLIFIKLHT